MGNNKALYQSFFENHIDLFPISMYPWFLDVSTDGNWDVSILKKGNNVLAVWPYYLKRKWGLNYITMPELTKWVGPIISPKIGPAKINSCLSSLFQALPKVVFIDQNFPYAIEDWSPFHWLGMKQEIKYSYQIDLNQSTESIYNNLNNSYQKTIQSFNKDDFSIVKNQNIDAFYQAHSEMFKRKGSAVPFSKDTLQKQYNACIDQNAGALYNIQDATGHVYSSVFIIWDKHTWYTHLITDDVEKRKSGASIFLMYNLIKEAKQSGKSTFDFEGSMIKPIQKVRKNFGAKRIAYHRAFKYANPLLSLIKKG